mmetsp:Transcript_22437/g.63814  ORF Transcript_22437/g.63814 Transcript_22437/m.63814 type:complete len:295 (-) Transcript_22437:199-1083(-)
MHACPLACDAATTSHGGGMHVERMPEPLRDWALAGARGGASGEDDLRLGAAALKREVVVGGPARVERAHEGLDGGVVLGGKILHDVVVAAAAHPARLAAVAGRHALVQALAMVEAHLLIRVAVDDQHRRLHLADAVDVRVDVEAADGPAVIDQHADPGQDRGVQDHAPDRPRAVARQLARRPAAHGLAVQHDLLRRPRAQPARHQVVVRRVDVGVRVRLGRRPRGRPVAGVVVGQQVHLQPLDQANVPLAHGAAVGVAVAEQDREPCVRVAEQEAGDVAAARGLQHPDLRVHVR